MALKTAAKTPSSNPPKTKPAQKAVISGQPEPATKAAGGAIHRRAVGPAVGGLEWRPRVRVGGYRRHGRVATGSDRHVACGAPSDDLEVFPAPGHDVPGSVVLRSTRAGLGIDALIEVRCQLRSNAKVERPPNWFR
jgi:hypothetical protein